MGQWSNPRIQTNMNIFLRILIGLLILGGGAFMVIRTSFFLNFFGHMEWAERKLGGGGSHLLYKVLGIVLCIVGIMVATNLWDAFLQATLGSVIPR
jgi:hypothetical protein